MLKAINLAWATREIEPEVIVPWELANQSLQVGRENEEPRTLIGSLEPSLWTLATTPSSLVHSSINKATIPAARQNPTQSPAQATQTSTPAQPIIAFQRADPRPFVPRNLQWQEVENRVPVVHAVASSRPPAQNEDLAIVLIDPLPGNELHFPAIADVLRDFFVQRRIHYTDIQPCHLGQAYVRFAHRVDRDNLVLQGRIQFEDVHVSFVKHNEGRNWRRAYFNTECWLMLMGFPADYWEHHYIQNSLSFFGKLLYFSNDRSRMTRLIVKARVLDLRSVPQFIVYSETQGMESDSWTVQCEVLQSRLLGGGPADEEPLPDAPIPLGAPFDFFGLGQIGNGPVHNPKEEEDEHQNQVQAAEPEQPPERHCSLGPLACTTAATAGSSLGRKLCSKFKPEP